MFISKVSSRSFLNRSFGIVQTQKKAVSMRSYIESMLTSTTTTQVLPEHLPKFYAKVIPTIR
jgi:hypothetical protein